MKRCLVLLALVAAACDWPWSPDPVPTGTTTIVNVTQTVGGSPGSPTASPSPGAGTGTCVPASSVRVGPFGFDCPSGTTVPNNNSGLMPLACTATATATPKNADGTNQGFSLHEGAVVTWGHLGPVVVTPDPEQPFNATIRWDTAAGAVVGSRATVTATVCGVLGSYSTEATR